MQRRHKSYVRPRYYRQWNEEEEKALQAGVERHGVGSWESIRKDPDLGILRDRTGVQLKDKWRNMVKFKHVPTALAAQAPPQSCDGSRHSDGLTGALHHLDLSSHDGDHVITATTDDDQEGSTRSSKRHNSRRGRSKRPPFPHEDKRFGIYDVRRYMGPKNDSNISPNSDQHAEASANSQQDGVVRCCCGATADDGTMMVECEQCLVWSHLHCLQRLALTSPSTFRLDLTAFVCPTCQTGLGSTSPNQHHVLDTAAVPWATTPCLEGADDHTLSPFALPGANPAPGSEESLAGSLALYAKHPEGKVHGGSLAMFALAASSLGGGSDDLFAELPGLDDALAMETEVMAAQAEHNTTSWSMLEDSLSAPRSCPDRPVGRSWPTAADVYGGALAASLAHTSSSVSAYVPSTLQGRGGSPPSSMSYVSSGDVYGMTPSSSSVNAGSSVNMPSSVPSPMYSPAGKRGGHCSLPPIARGGVSKVVGHRLDTAMSASASPLEFVPKAWLSAQRSGTPPEATSPDSIVAAPTDVELHDLDTMLFNEHQWPMPC